MFCFFLSLGKEIHRYDVFSQLSFLVKRKLQRKHAKGEIGVVARTKVNFCLAPQPLPLWNPPHPLCQKGPTQPTKILRAGQNCFVCLVGDVGESGTRCCFVSGETRSSTPKDQTVLQNFPIAGYPYTSPSIPILPALRRLCRRCPYPRK